MVESIISDIKNILPENYLQSFPVLKRLSEQALQIIPDEIRYRNERQAMQSIVCIMDNTGDANREDLLSWKFHVFRSKKEYALEALEIYLKKERSPFIYSY